MKKKNYIVCIFHFNRGLFLNNLITSIERHTNAPVLIFDDNSNDLLSMRLLNDLSQKYEVFKPPLSAPSEPRTGGLHSNIQNALGIVKSRGADLALMIQDDMQIVRDITDKDIDIAYSSFDRPNSSFVTATTFMKKEKIKTLEKSCFLHNKLPLYEVKTGDSSFHSYSDTGFFSVEKFDSVGGRLLVGESNNQKAIADMGLRLGFLAIPFMHYTPMPISFRAKKRHLKAQFADKLAGAGVHPINSLRGKHLERLMDRELKTLPYAEDFLRAPTLPAVRYWSLRGGKANLKSLAGWRRHIAKIL